MKRYDNWYGIKEFDFIYYNEWEDPTLVFDGTSINVHDIEDYFWEEFLEETGKDGDYEAFAKWMKEHEEDVIDYARDTIWNYREMEKRREAKELADALPF